MSDDGDSVPPAASTEQESSNITTELDRVNETPSKQSAYPAGLLPAFEILIPRMEKSGQGDENNKHKKMTPTVSRKLFSNTPSSRLALSTIQAYGSVEPQLNLNIFSKPIPSQQKPPNNVKRQHRSSSPVHRKKTKYGKVNAGVGHGIRKPRPQTKSEKTKQPSVSSSFSSNSQLNLKLEAIKNKLNKNRSKIEGSKSESQTSASEMSLDIETWDGDEETSIQLNGVVETLDSELETPEQDIKFSHEEDLFIQTEQEMSKINELIQIVQGDGSKEFLPSSSPSHELVELATIEKGKIQQVEILLDKLLGKSDTEGQIISISDIKSVDDQSLNLPIDNCDQMESESDKEEPQNTMDIVFHTYSASPSIESNSPSTLYLQNSQDVESFIEKLNKSNYRDPNDTDPFDDYNKDSDDESMKNEEELNMEDESQLTSISDFKENVEIVNNTKDGGNLETEKLTTMSSNISHDNKTEVELSDLQVPDDLHKADIQDSSLPSRRTKKDEELLSGQENVSLNCSIVSEDIYFSAQSSPTDSPASLKTKSDKLFPVFMKGKTAVEKSSSPSNRNTLPRCNFPLQEKDGKEQLLIDAGQKKFGTIICKECQFVYDPDVRKDVEYHFAHHNRHVVHLKHLGWKKERVIADFGKEGHILMVKAGDPSSWWKRVLVILETVNNDLGFNEEDESIQKSKIFLYVWEKNIVGCIVAEFISSANRMLPESQDLCTEEVFPAVCGIVRIWTSKSVRRKGFATKLMNAVRENFLVSRSLNTSEIAFSSPTPDGRAFATKYFKTPSFLVY